MEGEKWEELCRLGLLDGGVLGRDLSCGQKSFQAAVGCETLRVRHGKRQVRMALVMYCIVLDSKRLFKDSQKILKSFLINVAC